ncbi:MAG TPA: ABC transporter substrate-binding protein [Verrucomicrobiae bacterium]|nr:ABC transporter substrate-binding protein [Verrucomicrobiae bacterium]
MKQHGGSMARAAMPKILLALLCLAVMAAAGCSRAPAPVPVRLADARVIDSAPVYVAQEKGIFARHGVDMKLVPVPDGVTSMSLLVAGEADIACTGDMVASATALADRGAPSFTIISAMEGSVHSTALVADARKRIGSVQDLQGKKIGVPLGTAPHFFLENLLLFNRVPRGSVKLVDYRMANLPAALARGEIDAAALLDPYIVAATDQLAGNGKVFYGLDMYKLYWLVCCSTGFLKGEPDTVRRVLAALEEACQYVNAHPAEAAAVLSRYLKVTPEAARERMKQHSFALTLTTPVMLRLENQARWAIRRGMSDRKTMPVLPDYVNAAPLLAVKPERVTLVY